MAIPVFAIGGVAGLATLAGGWLALRLRANLDALAGFGGGVVIGVALMDLLPEALTLDPARGRALAIPALMTAGFMTYVVVRRVSARIGQNHNRAARHLGPASLVLHSLMDGLGIGVAFNVSASAGLIVAMAVLAHDLLDGSNVVTLALAGDLTAIAARRWLALDAGAPMIGLALSRSIQPPPAILAGLLAFFAGLFLFIGAVELLPRATSGSKGALGAASTVLGAVFIFVVVSLSAR